MNIYCSPIDCEFYEFPQNLYGYYSHFFFLGSDLFYFIRILIFECKWMDFDNYHNTEDNSWDKYCIGTNLCSLADTSLTQS